MSEADYLVCIVCPTGCRLRTVDSEGQTFVKGASCDRGREYATSELVDPRRTFTGTVRVDGADLPVVPVRSRDTVPRDAILDLAAAVATLRLSAPVHAGDVVARGLLGHVDLVATADAPVKAGERREQ